MPVRIASKVESDIPQHGTQSNSTPPRLPVRVASTVESDTYESPVQPLKMPVRLDSEAETQDDLSPLRSETVPNPSVMAMWKPISGKKMSSDWGALSIGIDDDREGETDGISSQKNDHEEVASNSNNNISPTAMWRPLRGKAESSDWGAMSIGGLVDRN